MNDTCPIEKTMGYVGKKWSINIIRDLFMGRKRFKDFLEANPELSTKMLSARLKELEQHGVIHKDIVSTSPVLIEYELTAKGRSLNQILYALSVYGIEHYGKELSCMKVTDKSRALRHMREVLQVQA